MIGAEQLLISDIPRGTVLAGRYSVREKLGDGAVASVYLATDAEMEQPVALKILDPLRGADPVGRVRFERELAALDRIVARALALRPEERFATAGELAAVLESGDAALGRPLQARLPCASCRTPLIIDLPICPGCGREVAWQLASGAYAVQLREVPEVEECAAWLWGRYHGAIAPSPSMLRSRLRYLPVPLAVGVSRVSAEQLLLEAEELGCRGDIIRGRGVLGAKLQAAAATPAEIILACALHLAVVAVSAIGLAVLGVAHKWFGLLPAVVGVAGIVVAAIYVRRPLLSVERGGPGLDLPGPLSRVRASLSRLTTERARSLAAGAIARAAPVLLGDRAGLSEDAERDIVEALEHALEAAGTLDAHAVVLLARPRSRLAAEMEEASARVERGDAGAEERLRALEDERLELTETAIAHDLAARRALEACQTISGVLATRTAAARAVASLG